MRDECVVAMQTLFRAMLGLCWVGALGKGTVREAHRNNARREREQWSSGVFSVTILQYTWLPLTRNPV
jgi:hypothetical protein